jgi:serine/threonine protein kinase
MPSIPQRLGDFEIIREIGRGGMGVVFEARQISLNRKVALKVLSRIGLNDKSVQRFRREAEAAGRLHHTNIVPVYAVGDEAGTHFYAMELIEGPSLDRVIRHLREPEKEPELSKQADSPASLVATGPYVEESSSSSVTASSGLSSGSHYFDTVARLIAEVADGLEYAHRQGVIHRDIKPSNLLLSSTIISETDGSLQGNRLSINDFGLARVLEQPGVTMTGEFVGTPAYMSPEQVTAGRTPLDHRTDIYSLGATLYELLTLQRPFTGANREKVLAGIIHKEPKAPRKLNHKVPVDLETICLKAMEKDPDRRYQSAGLMAEDLRRYVNRFAIEARRASALQHAVKWIRRRPAFSAALAAIVILAVAVAFFAYRASVLETRRLEDQERAQQELLAEKREAALDKAITAALGSNAKEAEKTIAAAERLGVSPGRVRLLRGLVAFYSGDLEQAETELEQAIALSPKSVAPRSLLAYVCKDSGRVGRAQRLWDELEALTPETPEDYLFKAYAAATRIGTVQSLRLVDEALQRHDSVIGREMRGELRAMHALDSGDLKSVELALADLALAKNLLPDSPEILSTNGYALLVAASLYQESGLTDKYKSALQAAREDAQSLERFDTIPTCVATRLWCYDMAGQEVSYLKLAQRALERGTTDDILQQYAWHLYERGQATRALEVLEHCKRNDIATTEFPRAIIVSGLSGGHGRAIARCKSLTARCSSAVDLWGCTSLFLFLGCKDEAIATSQRLRELPPVSDGGRYSGALNLLRGQLSEEQLLKLGSPSRLASCGNEFVIAMLKLVDGERDQAKLHLRAAVETRCFNLGSLWWSRTFLALMEKDPTWPPWIPVKK